MGGRREARKLGHVNTAALLAALKIAREGCLVAMTAAPISSGLYRLCGHVMGAIDDVAGIVTGNRAHYWYKPHSTPDHARPKRDEGD